MKNVIIIFLFLLSLYESKAQEIKVTLNQTTALILPAKISHVDLGSNQGIAFMLDDSIPKIVKLRINQLFIPVEKTNLLVVTQSDKIFSFNVSYAKECLKTVYNIPDSASILSKEKKIFQITQHHSINDSLHKVLINRNEFLPRVISKTKGGIKLTLNNIYSSDTTLYFLFNLQNRSTIHYNINYFSMYLTTNTTRKLSMMVTQDSQLPYTFIGEKLDHIATNVTRQFIIAIPKFTMEANQIGLIEIAEKNGGRHLKIRFSNNILLEATKLQ